MDIFDRTYDVFLHGDLRRHICICFAGAVHQTKLISFKMYAHVHNKLHVDDIIETRDNWHR